MTAAASFRVFNDYSEPTPLKYFKAGIADRGAVFTPKLLADEVWAEGRLLVGEGGALYRYCDGVYVRDGDEWVKTESRARLGDEYREGRVREVVAWCHAHRETPPDRKDTRFINVANGLLDWRTGTLYPHTPDHISVVQTPVEWNPDATCPLVDAFLTEALPGRVIDLLLELVGLLLIPETRYRKAALFEGPTGTGKSTTLTLIRNLLGASNVSAIGLQALGDDRFKVAELYGKLANIHADLDYRASKSSSVFKQVVGGTDLITGERKYGHPFSFVPPARLLFSANDPPASADQSDAYFARWLVFPFRNFPAVVDGKLDEKLAAPAELSGLLNKAVAGLQRLDARGSFDVPPESLEALQAYREAIDSVAGFYRDDVMVGPKHVMRTGEVYAQYRGWCDRNGERHPQKAARVIERLQELVPAADTRLRNGYNTWFGLKARVYVS